MFQSLEGTFKQCYFWNNSKLNRNGDPNLPVASPYFTLQRLFLSWVASFLFPVPHCTAPSTFSFHCLTLRSSNEPFPPQLSLIFCQLFALFSVLLLPFCLLSPTLLLLFFVRTPILNLQLHSLFYIFLKFVKLRRSLTITFQQSMWLSRQGPRLVSGTCVFNRSG